VVVVVADHTVVHKQVVLVELVVAARAAITVQQVQV
jgi:hypothetical protein